MARFLKALQGLQSDVPEANPSQEISSGSCSAPPQISNEPKSSMQFAADSSQAGRPATQTIVMTESAQSSTPEHTRPAAEQNELIQELTQQLAAMLEQRDKVAREVKQVKQELASHDQRHEDEIVRLRDTLGTHQQSSKKIEAELKQIQEELRSQLQKQQEEFSRKLSEVEQRVQAQSAALPSAQDASAERDIQQVREQLASYDKRYEEEVVRLRNTLESHQQSSQTLQTEMLKQLKRQEESFAKQLSDVEQRVQRQAAVAPPVKAIASEPQTVPPKPSAPMHKPAEASTIFKPLPSSATPEKPIPVTDTLRNVIASFDDPQLSQELVELCDSIFGPVELSTVTESQVIYLGTCVPGRDASGLALRLAGWLSQNACDVFLIDGALRNKTLSEQLGLKLSPGLFETVRRETYRQDGTYRDSDTGISVMPAGKSSFVLTSSEQDLASLRDQIREILKTCPIVLIAGEGPDSSASWLLAQVAHKTYLQADMGIVSREEIQAAVDCYYQVGVDPSGLIATFIRK